MSILDSIKFIQEYRREPLKKMQNLLHKEGRALVTIFGKKLLITSIAEDVNYVLKENAANYLKGRTTQKLQILLGQGLVTAEGETWKKQHKLIRPLMNTKGIIQLIPKMTEVIEYHFSETPKSSNINASEEMTLLTWRIVLNTLFSVGPKEASEGIKALDGILIAMDAITLRTRTVIPIPFWVPTKKNLQLKKTIKNFDQFIYSLIEQRRKSNDFPNDLLSILLKVRDGEDKMSDKQIRDEMITFMMAGHETVANSLSWLMILLAQNPSYFEKLKTETESCAEHGSIEERLQSLSLHKAAIDESQRLFPPIWIFMRESINSDLINDISIPKKTNVVVVPFVSHRSSRYWESAESFKPERFLNTKPITGAYYPFGLGPRGCIGFNFATYESILILEHLIKNFKWSITKPEEQSFYAGLTLRPTNNIEMKLERI